MNSTLTTAPGRYDHPPHPTGAAQRREPRRVGVLDRLALHLGVALITWSRRPLVLETRERRATRVEQELARAERERRADRTLRLTLPPR